MKNVKFIPPSLIDYNGTISNIEMCVRDANSNNEHMTLAMLQVMRRQAEMNAEMYAMLDRARNSNYLKRSEYFNEIGELLARARGES